MGFYAIERLLAKNGSELEGSRTVHRFDNEADRDAWASSLPPARLKSLNEPVKYRRSREAAAFDGEAEAKAQATGRNGIVFHWRRQPPAEAHRR